MNENTNTCSSCVYYDYYYYRCSNVKSFYGSSSNMDVEYFPDKRVHPEQKACSEYAGSRQEAYYKTFCKPQNYRPSVERCKRCEAFSFCEKNVLTTTNE